MEFVVLVIIAGTLYWYGREWQNHRTSSAMRRNMLQFWSGPAIQREVVARKLRAHFPSMLLLEEVNRYYPAEAHSVLHHLRRNADGTWDSLLTTSSYEKSRKLILGDQSDPTDKLAQSRAEHLLSLGLDKNEWRRLEIDSAGIEAAYQRYIRAGDIDVSDASIEFKILAGLEGAEGE